MEDGLKVRVDMSRRLRVNFSVSTKGVVTPDVTAEIINCSIEAVIAEATRLLDAAKIVADERTKQNTGGD